MYARGDFNDSDVAGVKLVEATGNERRKPSVLKQVVLSFGSCANRGNDGIQYKTIQRLSVQG